MAEKNTNADIAEMSYEQARDELSKVLGELEQGAVTLEHHSLLLSLSHCTADGPYSPTSLSSSPTWRLAHAAQ